MCAPNRPPSASPPASSSILTLMMFKCSTMDRVCTVVGNVYQNIVVCLNLMNLIGKSKNCFTFSPDLVYKHGPPVFKIINLIFYSMPFIDGGIAPGPTCYSFIFRLSIIKYLTSVNTHSQNIIKSLCLSDVGY